jgi:hypothetical protein
MTDRLSPQREAEIAERLAEARHLAAEADWPLEEYQTIKQQQTDASALLAELAAVRDERDEARAQLEKYVGKEPTVAEEMEYLSSCLNAVHDLCGKAEQGAKRWEHPLPVPEWVEEVRKAATGERANDPSDNRHRIYIDGKGNGWISVCSDEGTEWVVPIQPAAFVEQDVRDVADETGSLREIGRCW